MKLLGDLLCARAPRGMSSAAAIIIAAILVLLGSSVIMWMLRAVLGVLWAVLQIGVLVLIILVVASLIRSMSKKV